MERLSPNNEMTADVRIAESSEYKSFIHSSILILNSGEISCDVFLGNLPSLASTTLFSINIRQLYIDILAITSIGKHFFFNDMATSEIYTNALFSPI